MNEDLSSEIEELHRKTQEVRLQFLDAEVGACRTTLDFGRTALEIGSRRVADQEAQEAKKGIETIVRFLPFLENPALRSAIGLQVEELQRGLQSFKRQLSQ